MLTVQMIMTFSATSCTTPGWAYHQTIVATAASTSSTIMPAAETAIRCHLLGNRQASLTSQYRHGANTSSMKPSSCTSPPKCLQASAWPSSCSTFTAPIASSSQRQISRIEQRSQFRQPLAELVEMADDERRGIKHERPARPTTRPAKTASAAGRERR